MNRRECSPGELYIYWCVCNVSFLLYEHVLAAQTVQGFSRNAATVLVPRETIVTVHVRLIVIVI